MAHWDQIIDLLEQGFTVDVIYTDFAKAFDKCETNVLLHTLKKCGIKGKFGEWIAAFLDSNSRIQYVGVDGSLSTPQKVISGVPQGTVLGPALFLVHIMDLCQDISPETYSSSFADDTKIWRGIKDVQDCELLQKDLCNVYQAAAHINMEFNSKKFEWLRYAPNNTVATYQYNYSAPDSSDITLKTELRDLGVRLSTDLSFNLQVEKAVSSASQVAGWGLRTFRTRSRRVMIQLLKSLVQPHLDYCSQLWSPSAQQLINKIEGVQKSLVNQIHDSELMQCDYWQKLNILRLYSQERRRERYQIIFIWKISQGMISGLNIPFSRNSRTGRWAVPSCLTGKGVSANVKHAKESSLRVKGCRLFNILPAVLRNADHGDLLMFKNNLDHFLSSIPDQPTTSGLQRAAETNSLIHQVPMVDGW